MPRWPLTSGGRGLPLAWSRERETGSLEAGKRADFVVLDANPLEAEPERITGIKVLGGAPVYPPASIFRS